MVQEEAGTFYASTASLSNLSIQNFQYCSIFSPSFSRRALLKISPHNMILNYLDTQVKRYR